MTQGSALEAAQAGVDMEMASTTYKQYLAQLVEQGKLSESIIDQAVARILRLKLALGLFRQSLHGARSSAGFMAIPRRAGCCPTVC